MCLEFNNFVPVGGNSKTLLQTCGVKKQLKMQNNRPTVFRRRMHANRKACVKQILSRICDFERQICERRAYFDHQAKKERNRKFDKFSILTQLIRWGWDLGRMEEKHLWILDFLILLVMIEMSWKLTREAQKTRSKADVFLGFEGILKIWWKIPIFRAR